MVCHLKTLKATQAAAVLLHMESGKQMSYLRLLKLLYIADRESLRETGRSITGDHAVAMKHGPVLSGVLDLIKAKHIEAPLWSQFIKMEGYRVALTNDPKNGELSRYEIAKLQEVSERYAANDDWDMVEITHRFQEWIRNDPGESSKPIAIEDILDAVGRSADKEAIMQELKDQAVVDRFFTG